MTKTEKRIIKDMKSIDRYMDINNKEGFGKRTDILLNSTERMSKNIQRMLIFTTVAVTLFVTYLAYMSTSNIALIP